MATASFLHSGYPKTCISLNLIVEPGWEEFPQRMGTGFFVRRHQRVYYLTARHCLKSIQSNLADTARKLHIPFFLEGKTSSHSDYVEFDEVISSKHQSDDIPGELIDLVVLSVRDSADRRKKKELLSRAVKLPPTGDWLDKFINSDIARSAIQTGEGIQFSGIGYPYHGTTTEVAYPGDSHSPVHITVQPAKFTGHLTYGSYADRLMLQNVTWTSDLDGFSGSPVFAGLRNANGHQYALAGMLVTGGGGKIQFVKINVITQAFGL